MARKPETTAAGNVNKKLHSEVYFEKMNNPYRGGTPDFYYEGCRDCMWTEYKWYETKPKAWDMKKKLSRLQQKWLRRAHANNRLTSVIAGYPKGYAVFLGESWDWDEPTKDDMSAQDVAKWIELQVS
jgi:hypothetical protein